MNKIRHIFFDLDRTLWDFEGNSRRVIHDLFHEHNLDARCNTHFDAFLSKYLEVNHSLWEKYRTKEISKEQLRSSRFYNSMQHFGFDDFELGYNLEEQYVKRSPYQKTLMPDALDTVKALSVHYTLHIITNGFKEVQYIKLENSGLRNYFHSIIISEEVGHAKPHPGIFAYALQEAKASAAESMMVGDDLAADVIGGMQAGLSGCYFNPEGIPHTEQPHLEIRKLRELLSLI